VIIDSIYPTVATDDFARRFSQRGGNLMWLLGAGASAAASIPTAWDMIWEFKQQLYVSQRRVSPKQVAELFTPGRCADRCGGCWRCARCRCGGSCDSDGRREPLPRLPRSPGNGA
jgi:hypothetical protein